jgi:xanthine dehydrogenase small subunit
MRNQIIFYLNGKRHTVENHQAKMMLAEYLRFEKNLTGTKIVCAEGDCGACSVLRYFPHEHSNQNYQAINSCITPLAILDGSSLITVEGLKNQDKLHPVQESMLKCHGSQCGFCTPGFVVALAALVEENKSEQKKEIKVSEAKNAMTGNLCRCTGYAPIIEAATEINLKDCDSLKERYYDSKQAQDLKDIFKSGVSIKNSSFQFFAPKTIKEASLYLKDNPEARIIASSTDLGVIHNKRKTKLPHLVSLHLINELYEIKETSGEITLGARVTIEAFRKYLKNSLPELSRYIDIFASPQIKNIATVVGNIANASPIGDLPPALMALEAQVKITGPDKTRVLPLEKLFLSYRKTDLAVGEIIESVTFKIPTQDCDYRLFKNSNRKDLDISAINLAIKINWKDKSKKEMKNVVIAGGGLAATAIRFPKTEQYLKNHSLSSKTIHEASNLMQTEFNPLSDLRASESYRRLVISHYFKRFFSDLKRTHP